MTVKLLFLFWAYVKRACRAYSAHPKWGQKTATTRAI
jgi:hypothetical protein